MKRVAFLSYDWDYEIMASYYEGMEAFLANRSDVQLVIFNAFGLHEGYDPESGSFEVFSICDLDRYDGFIIQGNRNWPPDYRQQVVDRVRALQKPIVSINYELDGAHCVGTDNFESMFVLVSRILKDRKCTRPAFVNGLISSWEAKDRAQGFWQACSEAGIPSPRFFQASWETESGIEAALKMINAPDDLPDVVFCCNDDLAIGVQETLQEHGVRVPEDVMVTGFDNRDISLSAQPRITTVDRDYRTIGRTAVETIIDLMDGRTLPERIASPARFVLSESCGYVDEGDVKENYAASLYSKDAILRQFFRVLMHFQPAILNADSTLTVLLECERYFPELRCPNVYLMINDDYLAQETANSIVPFGNVSLLVAHSGDNIKTGSDERHIYARFTTQDILPRQIPMDKPLYMVFPLRNDATCIGMLVTEGVSPLHKHGFLSILLTLLASSIESSRKREILQNVNARLDELYVHDHLTGLFNRFGLERYGSIAYKHMLRDFEEAQFIFVDVDWMKQINDVHGHEAGDQALRDTAGIIKRAMEDENAFGMRYGGDEFLLISRRDLTPKLLHEHEVYKATEERPFDLSLSIGAYRVTAADHYSLAEAVDRADQKMYEIKKTRKPAFS